MSDFLLFFFSSFIFMQIASTANQLLLIGAMDDGLKLSTEKANRFD